MEIFQREVIITNYTIVTKAAGDEVLANNKQCHDVSDGWESYACEGCRGQKYFSVVTPRQRWQDPVDIPCERTAVRANEETIRYLYGLHQRRSDEPSLRELQAEQSISQSGNTRQQTKGAPISRAVPLLKSWKGMQWEGRFQTATP